MLIVLLMGDPRLTKRRRPGDFRIKTPIQKWQQDLDAARQYKFLSRPPLHSLENDSKPLSRAGIKVVEMVLDQDVVARVSKMLHRTEVTLQDYRYWHEFDDDIKAVYEVVQKLALTLQISKITLAQDFETSDPNITVGSLQSCKMVTVPLLARLSELRSDRHAIWNSKRSSSHFQAFEDRENLVDTFRKRMRKRLHKTIVEVESIVVTILEDLDVVLHNFQRTLLEVHFQKWRPPNEPLPDLKLTPLQSSGPLKRCKDCTELFELRHLWPASSHVNPFQPCISFNTSVLKLFDSAGAGCHFCRLQLTRLLLVGPHIKDISRAHVTWWKYWAGDPKVGNESEEESFSKDFRIRYLASNSNTVHFDYYITTTLTQVEKNRRIGQSTSSRTTISIARLWIKTCLSNHELCIKSHSHELKRPSRLIFLGIGDTVEPQLVPKEETCSDVRYVTLSHRWSDSNIAKLTTTNYSGLVQRIPTKTLPKTFMDVMKVAHRLGVFYIWIDSLCILQDSDDDWQRESSIMSDIYAGSWCNIAATGATTSAYTLFAERNPCEIRGCILGERGSKNVLKVHAHDEGARIWESSVVNSPLMKRGWVWEEMINAPRTLHFGKDRIFWECKTQKASETSPYDIDLTHKRYQPGFQAMKVTTRNYHGPADWANVVRQYSSKEFTFPAKDKLVAISGIARQYGKSHDYLAGLWRPDLLFQLTWRILHTKSSQSHSAEWQAPSWTWASLNRETLYSSHPDKTRIRKPITKIVSTGIIHLSADNIFGQVGEGLLCLHAPLLSFKYHRLSPRAYSVLYHNGSTTVLPSHHEDLLGRSISLDSEEPFSSTDHDDTPHPPTFLIPLYTDVEKNAQKKVAIHALIVEGTGKVREFVRRGVVSFEGNWWVENLKRCCQSYVGFVEEEVYERMVGEEEGWPLYDVILV